MHLVSRSVAPGPPMYVVAQPMPNSSQYAFPGVHKRCQYYFAINPRKIKGNLRYPNLKPQDPTISLIQQLPNEILGYIFEIGSRNQWKFPLIVSAVCSHWRRVAISNPRLWTYIDLDDSLPLDGVDDPLYPRSSLWLSRSKNCPLTLDLNFSTDMKGVPHSVSRHYALRSPDAVKPEEVGRGMSLVKAHANRWQTLNLRVNSHEAMYEALHRFHGDATKLKSLSLMVTAGSSYQHNGMPAAYSDFPLFTSAPSITSLVLVNVPISWDSCLFKGLKELVLQGHPAAARPSFERFMDILAQCPDLERLDLRLAGPFSAASHGSPDDPPSDRIELPALKHIQLKLLHPTVVRDMFARIFAPNVQNLSLEFVSFPEQPFVQADLTQMFNTIRSLQPFPVLQDFSLSGPGYLQADVVNFLAHVPSVLKFTIGRDEEWSSLLPAISESVFSPTGDHYWVLPKLKDLVLCTSSATGKMLKEFVQRRQIAHAAAPTSVASLRSLSISLCENIGNASALDRLLPGRVRQIL